MVGGYGAAGGRGSPWWWSLALVPLLCLRRRRAANAGPHRVLRPGFASGVVVLALAFACSGDSVGGTSDEGDGDDDAPPGADDMPDADDPDGSPALHFTYDANGARIQQVEGEVTRRHLGDGYEIEVGGEAIKYVGLADAIVARKQGDTRTWVHTDHLGSIQAATDIQGAEVHRKQYRPYGEILATVGPLAFEPRGYTGQRHDASDLLYLHARYYDPALARFISPDSVLDGDDTIGLNRYAYVGNDPVNHNDVDGQCKDGDCPKPGLGSRLAAGLKRSIVKVDAIATITWALTSATPAGPAAQPVTLPDLLMPQTSVAQEAHNPSPPMGKLEVSKPPSRPTPPTEPDPRKPAAGGGANPPKGAIRSTRFPQPPGWMRLGKLGGPWAQAALSVGLDGWGYFARYSDTRTNGGSIPAAMFNGGAPLASKYSFGPISAGISDGLDVLQAGIDFFKSAPDTSGAMACGRIGRCN